MRSALREINSPRSNSILRPKEVPTGVASFVVAACRTLCRAPVGLEHVSEEGAGPAQRLGSGPQHGLRKGSLEVWWNATRIEDSEALALRRPDLLLEFSEERSLNPSMLRDLWFWLAWRKGCRTWCYGKTPHMVG